MTAQSPGVPVIPKRRAPRSLTRIGRCRLTACETPLWSCRRDHPHLSGELDGDPLENLEARRIDAVVIGNKNAIEHGAAPECGQ
jgi:hypothetical protein